ncbi:hypothetical protein V6N13_007711 [Hibiscus sabdariffa]
MFIRSNGRRCVDLLRIQVSDSKKLEKQNEAYIMKIVFYLLAKKDGLRVKFLCNKFRYKEGILEVLKSQNYSHLWKGHVNIWSDVRNNITWCVGSGSEIEFWFDSWLGKCGPFIDLATAAGAIGMNRVTIVDTVNSNGNWQWSLFENLLPWEILFLIAAKKMSLAIKRAIVWNIWLHRNAIVFEKPLDDSRSILECSKDLVEFTGKAWVDHGMQTGLQGVCELDQLCGIHPHETGYW